eukprot:542353-Rhodomonas_salina.2
MKAPPELLQRLIPSTARRTESQWRTLDISLGYSMSTSAEAACLLETWNTELKNIIGHSSVRPLQVGSRRKASVQTHDSFTHKTLRFILDQPETLWVEERVARELKNKYAAKVVAGEKLYLWEPKDENEEGEEATGCDAPDEGTAENVTQSTKNATEAEAKAVEVAAMGESAAAGTSNETA